MPRHIPGRQEKKGTLALRLVGCLLAVVVVAAGMIPRSTAVENVADTGVTVTIPLQIKNVRVSTVTPNRCKISWRTNAESNSQVLYDSVQHELWELYPGSIIDSEMVEFHSLFLTGLDAGTTYHFRVRSAQEELVATSGDLVFTTKDRGRGNKWWSNWWKW